MYLSLRFLVIGLILLNISVNAQMVRPLDLRKNLKLIEIIDLTTDELYQATFTETNEILLTTFNRLTRQWAFRKDNLRRMFSPCSGDKYRGGILSNDGNRLVTICPDLRIEVWNLDNGRKLTQLQVSKNSENKHDEEIVFLNLSPDGKTIAFSFRNRSERAELWDVESGNKIADLNSTFCNCNRSVYSVVFSPDSKVVAIAFGGMVSLWNAENGELLNRLVETDPDFWGYDENDQLTGVGTVRHMLFSKDSKTIITGSGIGIASLWEVKTGELLRKFKKHKLAVAALALTPDEKILATGSRNHDVKLWELKTGKQLFSLDNRKEVRRILFHPNGARLLSMTSTHAFIWETGTGRLLEEMPIPDLLTTSFSPDWKYVIMSDKKTKTLRLYEYLGR